MPTNQNTIGGTSVKKFLCLIAGLILLNGCATKKISKTSFMDAMRNNNFCAEFSCSQHGLLKEKVNALALECWRQELQNLPPMFTKHQIDEITPSIKLCVKTKMKTTPIISKEEFLYALANKDFYSDYPKAAEIRISRRDVNNIVIDCYEKEMESLTKVFSSNQFDEIEPDINICVKDKFATVAKIHKKKILDMVKEKLLFGEYPGIDKLVEFGVDIERAKPLIMDCLKQEMKSLPSFVTVGQSELIMERCFDYKLKSAAIISKDRLMRYLSRKYLAPEADKYGIEEKELKKIVLGCIEPEIKNLPSMISYNQFMMTFGTLNSAFEACVIKKIEASKDD